jgi:hypothetical protein
MSRHFDEAAPRWRYLETEQPPLNTKLMLLTHDNQLVTGPWKGRPLGQNETYKAWSGLPRRDKALEKALGYI